MKKKMYTIYSDDGFGEEIIGEVDEETLNAICDLIDNTPKPKMEMKDYIDSVVKITKGPLTGLWGVVIDVYIHTDSALILLGGYTLEDGYNGRSEVELPPSHFEVMYEIGGKVFTPTGEACKVCDFFTDKEGNIRINVEPQDCKGHFEKYAIDELTSKKDKANSETKTSAFNEENIQVGDMVRFAPKEEVADKTILYYGYVETRSSLGVVLNFKFSTKLENGEKPALFVSYDEIKEVLFNVYEPVTLANHVDRYWDNRDTVYRPRGELTFNGDVTQVDYMKVKVPAEGITLYSCCSIYVALECEQNGKVFNGWYGIPELKKWED